MLNTQGGRLYKYCCLFHRKSLACMFRRKLYFIKILSCRIMLSCTINNSLNLFDMFCSLSRTLNTSLLLHQHIDHRDRCLNTLLCCTPNNETLRLSSPLLTDIRNMSRLKVLCTVCICHHKACTCWLTFDRKNHQDTLAHTGFHHLDCTKSTQYHWHFYMRCSFHLHRDTHCTCCDNICTGSQSGLRTDLHHRLSCIDWRWFSWSKSRELMDQWHRQSCKLCIGSMNLLCKEHNQDGREYRWWYWCWHKTRQDKLQDNCCLMRRKSNLHCMMKHRDRFWQCFDKLCIQVSRVDRRMKRLSQWTGR